MPSILCGLLLFVVATLIHPAPISRQIKQVASFSKSRVEKTRVPDFNFGDTCKIAVYKYGEQAGKYDKHHNRADITYTISKQEDIQRIIEAFNFQELDGTTLGALPSAYVYFKNSDGKVYKAKIVGWQYILLNDDWKNLYPISEKASELLEKNMQYPKIK